MESGAARTLDATARAGRVVTVAHDWITAPELAALRAAVPPGTEMDVEAADGVVYRGVAGAYRVLRQRGALAAVEVDVAAAPFWPPEGAVWWVNGVIPTVYGDPRNLSIAPGARIDGALMATGEAARVADFVFFNTAGGEAGVYAGLYLAPLDGDAAAAGPELLGGADAHLVSVRFGRDRVDVRLGISDDTEPYIVRNLSVAARAAAVAAADAVRAAAAAGTARAPADLAIVRWPG